MNFVSKFQLFSAFKNMNKIVCRSAFNIILKNSAVFYSVHPTFDAKCDLMLPADSFRGRLAIVTGGGTGLGKGIATNLAKLGANVFIISRKNDVLKRACSEIRLASGNENVAFEAADVRDPDAISKAIDACVKQFGESPNIVVNNAAGNFISPTERLSSKATSSIIDIVLKGTLNVTMETGKRLIAAKKGGTYLCISATYASTGSGYVVPSAMAKAGVEAMVKSLAVEWAPYGLRFNAIAPGPIYTKGAFSRLDPTGQFAADAAERLPARRLGQIEELANLACYLLSPYSSWMTGEVINLDGGEGPALSGEFNILQQVFSSKDWDAIEKKLKTVKGS